MLGWGWNVFECVGEVFEKCRKSEGTCWNDVSLLLFWLIFLVIAKDDRCDKLGLLDIHRNTSSHG